jgi:hypothetical protein
MSIRFSCTTCGQRLSVGLHRAGQKSTCPKCKVTLLIPQASGEPATPVVTANRTKPAMAVFSLTEDPVPTEATSPAVNESPATPQVPHPPDELELIAVPRYVIFSQGFLLIFIGIVCFFIGLAVGSATLPKNPQANLERVLLTGTVALSDKGKRSGDVGAIVTFIPFDALPETKGSMIGLRPGDAGESQRAIEFLQSIHGATARCDERGQFEVRLPRAGKYYLLVVSSTGSLRSRGSIPQQQLGQMSKFFDMAEDPLENFRFQWRIENVRPDIPLTIDFD